MNARRKLLFALGLGSLAASLTALAQSERHVRRIGFFTGTSLQNNTTQLAAFREGMAALRWIEGRDYVIDARYGNGVAQAYAGLADELLAARPDLLLATGDASARLLADRTKTLPIVFTIVQDPVGAGLAASLQRPGGNVTGLTSLARELGAKRLQLLKEAFPRIANVVVLVEPTNRGSVAEAKEMETPAARLKIRVTPIEVRQAADIEAAFKRGAALGVQAYIVTQSSILSNQRQAIADLSRRFKVPAIAPITEYVEAGGLMSYGPNFADNYRRAASYVDKIFKGAKPGDLPIEQPVKFELVVNMKTAKAMGFTIPQSVLLQADRVIE